MPFNIRPHVCRCGVKLQSNGLCTACAERENQLRRLLRDGSRDPHCARCGQRLIRAVGYECIACRAVIWESDQVVTRPRKKPRKDFEGLEDVEPRALWVDVETVETVETVEPEKPKVERPEVEWPKVEWPKVEWPKRERPRRGLSAATVARIRELYAAGEPVAQIATKLDVSESSVLKNTRGMSRRSVPPLTPEQIAAIRRMAAAGKRRSVIGRELGLSWCRVDTELSRYATLPYAAETPAR